MGSEKKTGRMEQWDVDKLLSYDKNSRTHSEEQVEQIAGSIREFGFLNPILVDGKDSTMIAGHGRLMAAKKLGLDKVPVVVFDHLTDSQRRAYVIADNKLALNAGWDEEVLAAELAALHDEGFNLEFTGFSDEEFDDIIDRTSPKEEPQGDEDAAPEVPEEAATKLGDIYVLGKHRLMCGDSTSIDAVEKLMNGQKADMVFTDPPYGVYYQSNMRTKSAKFEVIENDDTFLTEWIHVLPAVSQGWVFVWTTWKVLSKWMDITDALGAMTNMIVWDKGGGGIGDLDKTFSTDYEIALVFNRGAAITGSRLGSVWSVGKDRASEYVHPTQKPVELGVMALENCTNKNAAILDLFGGSGSTLIAAEKSKRRAFLMELDPKYCDVIVLRWEQFTGKKAVLLGSEEVNLPETPKVARPTKKK